MKIQWREVFKFLSGAAFAGSLAHSYLWLTGISVPFFGYTIAPNLVGSILQFVLCVVFVYFGWFSMKQPTASDDISRLRQHLQALLAVWDGAFSHPIRHDDTNLAFMALAFAARQGEHARSVFRLGNAVDAPLLQFDEGGHVLQKA
jgi:hypothetical protein